MRDGLRGEGKAILGDGNRKEWMLEFLHQWMLIRVNISSIECGLVGQRRSCGMELITGCG